MNFLKPAKRKPEQLRKILEKKTVTKLKSLCEDLKFRNFQSYSKNELIDLLLTRHLDLNDLINKGWWAKYHNHVYGIIGIVALIFTLWQVFGDSAKKKNGNNEKPVLIEHEEYLTLQPIWAEAVRSKDFQAVEEGISLYENKLKYKNLYLLYKGTYVAMLLVSPSAEEPSNYLLEIDHNSYFFRDAILMLVYHNQLNFHGSLFEAKMDRIINDLSKVDNQIELLYFVKLRRYKSNKTKLREIYEEVQQYYSNFFNFSTYEFGMELKVGDRLNMGTTNPFYAPPTFTYLYLQDLCFLSHDEQKLNCLKELDKLISINKSRIEGGLKHFWISSPLFYPINHKIAKEIPMTLDTIQVSIGFAIPDTTSAEMYHFRTLDKKLISKGLIDKNTKTFDFQLPTNCNDVEFILSDRYKIISVTKVFDIKSKAN